MTNMLLAGRYIKVLDDLGLYVIRMVRLPGGLIANYVRAYSWS